MPLIEMRDLNVTLDLPDGPVQVVKNVSLAIGKGEIFGIVGESGSGKTMTCNTLLGLTPPSAKVTATALTLGTYDLQKRPWAQIRGREVAMIFQDPAAALNPVFTIAQQIEAVLRQHSDLKKVGRKARIIELLQNVGLPEPKRTAASYPHQISGGMQQRALIAMALSAGANVLIADEPTTALDVTVQAQILTLLRALRDRHGLTIILVSHDLAVVSQICDRVGVMLHGEIVETGHVHDVLQNPQHAYTKALLGSAPRAGSRGTPLPTVAAQMIGQGQ
ncbi:ABC transporter ATP-binding protein [Octadecabacter sp.]|nr:ABC transporter ATP-binding protein [Octadecabacter sp.]MDC1501382.1 ABC transporter ATP-binding protein [Octadecabacter sp.]